MWQAAALGVLPADEHYWQPTYITRREPTGLGYRDLHSSNYRPVAYRVRAEVFYVRPDGTRGAVASAWTELTVRPAALSNLRYPRWARAEPILTTGSALFAEVRLTRLPPTSAGAEVTLTSSHPDAARIPAAVTVPWWRTYEQFTITGGIVTVPTEVTITATYGGQSRSLSFTMLPIRRVAVFRPSTAEWLIREVDGAETRIPFGDPGDRPVPAEYQGTGRTQLAVFRPTTSGNSTPRPERGSSPAASPTAARSSGALPATCLFRVATVCDRNEGLASPDACDLPPYRRMSLLLLRRRDRPGRKAPCYEVSRREHVIVSTPWL